MSLLFRPWLSCLMSSQAPACHGLGVTLPGLAAGGGLRQEPHSASFLWSSLPAPFIRSQVGGIPPAPAQPPPRILFGDQHWHLGGPSVQMPLWCVLDKQGAPKFQWPQGRRGQLEAEGSSSACAQGQDLGYFPCYGFTAWPRAVRLAMVLEVAANSGVWEA